MSYFCVVLFNKKINKNKIVDIYISQITTKYTCLNCFTTSCNKILLILFHIKGTFNNIYTVGIKNQSPQRITPPIGKSHPLQTCMHTK